jgi:hypothetical protein
MSPLTCPDVEARLELYAADECDPAETEAIRRHLAGCPRCAATCEEARQLVGLLELRLQEPERLRRLEARIAAEEAPRRRVLRFPVALRRVAALAALLLVTVGLVAWLAPGLVPVEGDGGLAVALRQENVKGTREMVPGPPAVVARMMAKTTPQQYREQLADAPTTGRWPPPPEVDLALVLRNTTDRDLRVWVAGPQAELRLDLRGPGAVSVPLKETGEAKPQNVELPPGESHVIRISRLTDGHRAWYWTEPGDYTVTAEFTTRASIAGGRERRVTARSEPVPVHVEGN